MRGGNRSAKIWPQHVVEPFVAGRTSFNLHNLLIIELEFIVARHASNSVFVFFANGHSANILFNARSVNVAVCEYLEFTPIPLPSEAGAIVMMQRIAI